MGANINYNFAVHVDKDLANYTKYGKIFYKSNLRKWQAIKFNLANQLAVLAMTALIHSNQISMLCFICVRLICMHILSYAENKQKVSGSTILTQDLDPLEHYATCPKDARIYISV